MAPPEIMRRKFKIMKSKLDNPADELLELVFLFKYGLISSCKIKIKIIYPNEEDK